MKKIIFLIVALLFSSFSSVHAELKTFIKEYNYQASEYDSKVTCRTLALEQVKRLLLEELGTYLESETIIQDYKLSKDQITVITGGIVQTTLIDEKWDGNSYWVKVELSADPQELSKSIDRILGNAQLLKQLNITKKKADNALQELEKLRKAKHLPGNKLTTKKKYQKEVNELSHSDEWREDFKLLLEAGIDIGKGKYDEAILTTQAIINKKVVNPDNLVQAYLTIGFAYKQKEMFPKAIEALRKAQTICKSDSAFVPLIHNYLGRTYMDMKTYPKAIPEFEKAIYILNKKKKEHLKHERSNYDRILGTGTFQSSIDFYDIEMSDNLMCLAYAYLLGGEPEIINGVEYLKLQKKMTSAIKRILEIKPDSPDILDKIHLLTSKEDLGDVRVWCEKLIKRYPSNSKLYLVRGRTYIGKENQQAIEDFSRAIQLDPQNFEPYKFRGNVFVIIGNYEMAIKDYDEAIAMKPSERDLYFLRGYARCEKITIMKDGKPHLQKKDESQLRQALDDILIAARLGNEPAQDWLRRKGMTW